MQIRRLSSGKSFIGKRKKFIFNAFVDYKLLSLTYKAQRKKFIFNAFVDFKPM